MRAARRWDGAGIFSDVKAYDYLVGKKFLSGEKVISLPLSCSTLLAADLPLAAQLRVISQAGFPLVNLDTVGFLASYMDADANLNLLRHMLDDFNLGIDWIHAPFRTINLYSDDREIRFASLASLSFMVEQAAMLGGRVLIVHCLPDEITPGYETPAGRNRLIEAFFHLSDRAQKYKIHVATENLLEEKSHDLIEQILADVPGLYFCLDTGHAEITKTWDRWLPRYGARLAALHIHDNRGQEDEHLIPGDGIIDWVAFRKRMAAISYQGTWGMETILHHNGQEESARAAARRAYAAIASIYGDYSSAQRGTK